MSLNWTTIIVSAIQPEFVPKQAHYTDAGFDVFSRVRIEIQPHTIENIPVWVKVAMPKGKVCLVFHRSSLPLKKWLMLSNSVWVVDAWYRGEIHMQLYNLNNEPVLIDRGEKIWQLIFMDYIVVIISLKIVNTMMTLKMSILVIDELIDLEVQVTNLYITKTKCERIIKKSKSI